MIDYLIESKKFKPDKVTTLLIGEAPPPNERTYFYVPQEMNPNRDIRSYSSLPATIFYHYFKTIPDTIEKYQSLLC